MSETTDDAEQIARRSLGRAIEVQRTHLGMKRKDLAQHSGLSYPYISELENGGKEPSAKALRQIADALELGVAELVSRGESYRQSMIDGDTEPGGWEPPTSTEAVDRVPHLAYVQPAAPGRGAHEPDDLTAHADEELRKVIQEEIDRFVRRELPGLVRNEVHRAFGELARPSRPAP